MNYLLLIFVTAMIGSMLLISAAARLAPSIGMVDRPDARKVHIGLIPRVGGIGIVVGALVPLVLGMGTDGLGLPFILGALVLLLLGGWDDIRELPPHVKLLGQIAAAGLVVYLGDIYVRYFPFLGHNPIPAWIGRPFTVFALVGVINAWNTSDGLDGLAGGASVLSLSGLGYLSFQTGGGFALAVAVTTIGGVFGFLQFNSHPARVYMGDSGSQFLGYALGVLAVLFTQRINPSVSPAIVLFLLGFPVMDLLVVMIERKRQGLRLMRPTKTHLHHRLLALGLDHAEAVTVMYGLQAALVASSVVLLYERDGLVLGLYGLVGLVLFGAVGVAEAYGWRLRRGSGYSGLGRIVDRLRSRGHYLEGVVLAIQLGIGVLLFGEALWVAAVPRDLGVGAAVLAVALGLRLVFGNRLWFLFLRLILYVAVAFVAYLIDSAGGMLGGTPPRFETGFYALLALGIVLVGRCSPNEVFRITPMDFLVLILVLLAALVPQWQLGLGGLGPTFLVKVILLFYGCEVVMKYMRHRINFLTVMTLASLLMLAVRGLA